MVLNSKGLYSELINIQFSRKKKKKSEKKNIYILIIKFRLKPNSEILLNITGQPS